MFTREGQIILFADGCSEDESQKAKSATIEKLVLLEDGRLVPIEPGGMVEVALNELGANVVDVQIPSEEKAKQRD